MNLDYYQRPFMLISKPVIEDILKQPHTIRKSYWELVPEDDYSPLKARQLVLTYYHVILKEIEKIVSSKSRMYWLHLSRRILPSTSGKNKSPVTIAITRKIIDGAIEKYGIEDFCDSIGITGQIKISDVFDGLLMSEEFEYERQLLERLPSQVVLTKFNQKNILEYYSLEKLAYEVWKCGATLRAIGKGVTIIVIHSDNEYFFEVRTPELEFLIDNYDSRDFSFITSRKGVVLENQDDFYAGKLLIPVYNVANSEVSFFNEFFDKFEIPIHFGDDVISNFIPSFYPFKGYYRNNKPLFSEFYKKYEVEVVSILSVITAVSYRIFEKLIIEKELEMIKPLFLRGYQGPFLEKEVLAELEYFKEIAFLNLDLNEEEKEKVNILDGYNFLKINDRKLIDLLFTAPVKLFIPVSNDRIIIDYCKIQSILDDLMFGVRIKDENFKGDLFELATNKMKSSLPRGQCIAKDNSSKQVDYALPVNDILVICECKLKENSIGYYKGNFDSIQTRKVHVIDKSIEEADAKALWLSKNPIGKNYNVSGYKFILPIGLSAFKEFIPSINRRYWISDDIPRVLTIEEFNNILDTELISNKSFNLIKIKNDS